MADYPHEPDDGLGTCVACRHCDGRLRDLDLSETCQVHALRVALDAERGRAAAEARGFAAGRDAALAACDRVRRGFASMGSRYLADAAKDCVEAVRAIPAPAASPGRVEDEHVVDYLRRVVGPEMTGDTLVEVGQARQQVADSGRLERLRAVAKAVGVVSKSGSEIEMDQALAVLDAALAALQPGDLEDSDG